MTSEPDRIAAQDARAMDEAAAARRHEVAAMTPGRRIEMLAALLRQASEVAGATDRRA